MKMKFIWDEHKRDHNIKKHGLDFIDAPIVFDDPYAWFDLDQRYSDNRWILIGTLNNRIIVVIAYTEPKPDTIRIISMRPAIRKEVRKYEDEKTKYFKY